MLELIISDIDVSGWVTRFDTELSEADSESFTNHDGKKITGSAGNIVKLDIQLGRVPANISQKIAAALENEELNVSYNSPSPVSALFVKKRYRASAKEKGLTWDISLTLESAAPVGGSCL